jgi:hypothetical protein
MRHDIRASRSDLEGRAPAIGTQLLADGSAARVQALVHRSAAAENRTAVHTVSIGHRIDADSSTDITQAAFGTAPKGQT